MTGRPFHSVSLLKLAQVLGRRLGDAVARVPSLELTDGQGIVAVATNPRLKEAISRLGRIPLINNARARTVLGWGPRDAETTIVDTAESLLRLGLVD